MYGIAREVRSRAQKMVTQLRRGASLLDVVGSEEIDTASFPGLIVIDGPSSLVGGSPHCHVYLPFRLIEDRLLDDHLFFPRRGELRESALSTAWGTLGAIGPNSDWCREPKYFQPLVDAMLRFWPVFAAAGDRFSYGLDEGTSLWRCATKFHYALAQMGVPLEVLQKPLPPEGLEGVLKYIKKTN
jgi:hypothetical protein